MYFLSLLDVTYFSVFMHPNKAHLIVHSSCIIYTHLNKLLLITHINVKYTYILIYFIYKSTISPETNNSRKKYLSKSKNEGGTTSSFMMRKKKRTACLRDTIFCAMDHSSSMEVLNCTHRNMAEFSLCSTRYSFFLHSFSLIFQI